MSAPRKPRVSATAAARRQAEQAVRRATAIPESPKVAMASPAPTDHEELKDVAVRLIRPAADNLRKQLGDLAGLRASIKASGVLQPLRLVPIDPAFFSGDGFEYEVVDGHRRLAAASAEDLAVVPAVVRRMSESERVEAMLATALLGEDLKPSEEADGYRRLADLGMGQRTIADMFGVHQSHVSKMQKLTKLPEAARAAVDLGPDAGGITREQGQALADLPAKTVKELFKGNRMPRDWEVEEAVRRQATAEKRAKAEQEARDQGRTMIDPEKVGYNQSEGAVWIDWMGLGPNGVAAHLGESCHAEAWNGRAMAGVCTDPKRHRKALDVEDADRNAATDARTAEREAERAALEEARARRRAFCVDLVTKPKPIDVIALAAATLPDLYEMEAADFMELLPIVEPVVLDEENGETTHADWLARWAGSDSRRQLQVVYAVSLFIGDNHAERSFNPDPYEVRLQATFWAHLTGHGYEMSDLERSWLPAAAEVCQNGPSDEEAEPGRAEGEVPIPLVVPTCEECGCTDDDCSGCIERTGEACSWVRPGLCSACERAQREEPEEIPAGEALARESDRLAQKVCEALEDFTTPDSIPWPSIVRPLQEWIDGGGADGEAQAVCRALATHASHNGSIPWEPVRKAMQAWLTSRPSDGLLDEPEFDIDGDDPGVTPVDSATIKVNDLGDGPDPFETSMQALAEQPAEPEFEGSVVKNIGVGGIAKWFWECSCGANSDPVYETDDGADAAWVAHMTEAHGYAAAEA